MSKRPLVDIEINFDPDNEEFGLSPEQADARYVRVTIDERKIVPGSLSLGPPDPDDQSDGDTALCPIKIRPNTPVYPPDNRQVVEFRAELDIDSILSAWESVEDAAKEPRVFKVAVQVETSRPTGPLTVTGRGRVKINLNCIRWKWQPLTRDQDKNEIPAGPEEENTPIRCPIDGTGSHGFRLTLQREISQEDGPSKPGDADFTHYLSPDHKVDFNVLAMEPVPWKPEIQPTQQIFTSWWTQKLADNSILGQLPIETSIRTQAFPPHSITKRVSGSYIPEDTPRLAIREIPLHLGLENWKVRVVTPDPEEAPILLNSADLGVDVEIEIFDDSNPDEIVYMKNRAVQLNIRNGTSPNGQPPATIDNQSSGTWTTDDNGHFQFHLCVKPENGVFLKATPGQYYAEFDLNQPGSSPDKPGPKIRSSDTPDNDQPPSFVIDWAPKFDLQVFKLPYFTNEPKLDPDNLPSEDTVKAVELTLGGGDEGEDGTDPEETYCNLFRNGGAITLKPVVSGRAPASGDTPEFDLQDYRLIVGEKSKCDQTAKRQIIIVAPPQPDGTNGPPYSVTIPAGSRAGGAAAGQVTINQEIDLHPDEEKLLDTVADESGNVEDATQSSAGLTGATASTQFADSSMDFRELGVSFYNKAIGHFCCEPQKDLVQRVSALTKTLVQLGQYYLPFTSKCWERAGRAVQLHRQSFQRMLDNMLNFFYDFLLFGKVKEWLKEKFPSLNTVLDQMNPSIWVEKGSRALWARAARTYLAQKVLPVIEKFQSDVQLNATAVNSALTDATTNQAAAIDRVNRARDIVLKCDQAYSQSSEAWVDAVEKLEHARATYGTGPYTVGPDNLHPADLLANLEAKIQALGGDVVQNRAQVTRALDLHATTLKRRILAECQLQDVTARKAAIDALLTEANDHKARIDQVTKGLDDPETDLDNVEQNLKDLGTSLDATKAEEPPGIRGSLSQAYDSLGQEVQQNEVTWQTVARDDDYLLQQVQQRGGSLPASGSGPFQGLQATAQQGKAGIESGLDSIQGINTQARGLMETRVNSAAALWSSERALYGEARSDAVKSGQQYLLESTKSAIADPKDPPTQGESDEGYIHRFWSGFLSVIGKIIQFLDSWSFGLVSAFLRVLKWILDVLLGAVGFLLRLTARVGIKLMEAILAVVDFLRTGWRRASAFQDKARDAGFATLLQSGSDGDRLFEFSYIHESNIPNRFKEACEAAAKTKAGFFGEIDQILDIETRAGYDDSYPDMLRSVRKAYYGLCAMILDRPTLSDPPCDVDRSDAARCVAVGGQKLDNDIQQYLDSFNLSNADQDSWGASLFALYEASGTNLRVLEGRIEWVGWIVTWGARILAVICAIGGFFTWGAGFAAAFSLVEIAQLSDAVTALCRLVLHGWSCHFYATIYPRDAALLPAIAYAAALEPAEKRFEPSSPEDIIAGYRKQTS